MRHLRLIILSACFGLFSALSVAAAPITFIFTTLDASGTLEAPGPGAPIVFGTSDVTITATADTDDITAFSGGFSLEHLSATIDILGFGTFDFVSPTRTFVNNSISQVGFSRATSIGGTDLLNDFVDPAFAIWDMLTSIGPISDSSANYLQWATGTPIETTGGILVFNNGSVPGTFEAIVDDTPVIPLPAAGWLLIAGVGGFALMRKRS